MSAAQIFMATILVCLLVGLIRSPAAIQRWWLGRRSASWPYARISLNYGEVSVYSENKWHQPTGYELRAGYSYMVDGRRYSGEYRAVLASKDEANSLLKSLRELPPPVRYQALNPEVSVLEPYRDAALAFEQRQPPGSTTT